MIFTYYSYKDTKNGVFICLTFIALFFAVFLFFKFGAFVRKKFGRPEMENVWHYKNLTYATITIVALWLIIFYIKWAYYGKPA